MQITDNYSSCLLIVLPLLVFLYSVILHEIAHGWSAYLLGDDTAYNMGRISLNPLKHVDPFLTIGIPVMLYLVGAPIFGGAKPVPVNPFAFSNPRRQMAYVALAGPLINFCLASLCFLGFWLISQISTSYPETLPTLLPIFSFSLLYGFIINLLLGCFNLIPIPPLDGGRVVVGFLPRSAARYYSRLEPIGIPLVFALLYFGVLDNVLNPIINLAYRQLGAHFTGS